MLNVIVPDLDEPGVRLQNPLRLQNPQPSNDRLSDHLDPHLLGISR